MLNLPLKALRWLIEEAREKLDPRGTWHELKALGQKYGRRFFVAAVVWELVEDVVFPAIAVWQGVYWLVPFFLVMHFEPVVYPIFFFAFRTYDRLRGREPWEPARLGQSTHWRAGLQVLSYRVPAFFLFYVLLAHLGITPYVLAAYTVGMGVFGFVHDRIWHDSNFGIDVPTDTVLPKRVVVKALTYRVVSVIVMSSVLLGIVGRVPADMWAYQVSAFILSLVVGTAWARSAVGIRPVVQTPPRRRVGDA